MRVGAMADGCDVPLSLSLDHVSAAGAEVEVEQRPRPGAVRVSNGGDRDEAGIVLIGSSTASQENMGGADDRGRLRFHNVGGSLTFLLQIALVAFCVRQLRSVLAKRRDILSQRRAQLTIPHRPVHQPFFVKISPLAFSKLLQLDTTRYFLIDVRYSQAAQGHSLPPARLIHIPESEIGLSLQFSKSQWETRFSSKHPVRSDLLVFLSSTGRRAQRAAMRAAQLGYSGCCALDGGLVGYQAAMHKFDVSQPKLLSRLMDVFCLDDYDWHSDKLLSSKGCLKRKQVANLLWDAVAALLLKTAKKDTWNMSPSQRLLLVDVRRHDERALYGFIEGSWHLPVEEWPRALAMDLTDWEEHYHFPKFQANDIIIIYCRSNRRAFLAAQLANDSGLNRCYIYVGGSFDWRLETNVLPYDSYAFGDPPPEPMEFEVDFVDYEAANKELREKGFS